MDNVTDEKVNDSGEENLKTMNQPLGEETQECEKEEVATEKSKEDVYKEKFFYLAAEMDNLKKRYDREMSMTIKYGNEKILKDLINVLDNFERTVSSLKNIQDENVKNILVGIDMISKQFVETIKKHGVEELSPLGEMFDPNYHEALVSQEKEGAKTNEVIEVFQNGYSLNGRLIRAAKVIVAK